MKFRYDKFKYIQKYPVLNIAPSFSIFPFEINISNELYLPKVINRLELIHQILFNLPLQHQQSTVSTIYGYIHQTK